MKGKSDAGGGGRGGREDRPWGCRGRAWGIGGAARRSQKGGDNERGWGEKERIKGGERLEEERVR